jgi:hypothetical protein
LRTLQPRAKSRCAAVACCLAAAIGLQLCSRPRTRIWFSHARRRAALPSHVQRRSLRCEQPGDQGEVITAVAKCLKDNNFRVCQGSLSVLGTLVVEMGEDFRPYVGTVGCRECMPSLRARRALASPPHPAACACAAGSAGHDRKAR